MTTRINPVFQDISPVEAQTPNLGNWHFTSSISGVPEEAVPFMLAQGWEISGVFPLPDIDGNLVNQYGMSRTRMNNAQVIYDLLRSFTEAYNEGRGANDKRYEDIIRLYTEMFDKSQSHLDDAKTDLGNEIVLHMTTLDALESEYDTFFTQVKDDLNNLDLTMDADIKRVNDQFDSLVAASGQQLASRGFYSSALLVSMTAGIEERRALALTEISERLQRLRADIALRKNQVYVDVLRMRSGLIETKMGLTNRKQEFLKYQLDERNKILIGLFSFVEKREDSYPGLGSMAQVTASLGESGSAAWRSA
jgi:hypothetical protein